MTRGGRHGDLVELTPARDEDSDRYFEWINDRELVVLNGAFHPVAREEHDGWFARVRARQDMVLFSIRTVADGELIGSCQLHTIDPVHRSAELQIRIGSRRHWGRGLGTEAVRLLLQVGFADLGLHRIHLHVLADNERARRTYRRNGFVEEGVLREAAFVGGAFRDLVVMSILETEWRVG